MGVRAVGGVQEGVAVDDAVVTVVAWISVVVTVSLVAVRLRNFACRIECLLK